MRAWRDRKRETDRKGEEERCEGKKGEKMRKNKGGNIFGKREGKEW